MMHSRTGILILAVLLVPVLSLVGSTQTMDGAREMLRNELERTDHLIDRARDAVQHAENPVAVAVIERAKTIQSDAWIAFNASKYLVARTLTMKVRELLGSAMAMSRATEQSGDVVQRRLERSQDRLDRAKDILDNGECGHMKGLFDAARENLNRAWEFYRRGQNRPGLKLANQVEEAARRIIDQCGKSDGNDGQFNTRRDNVAGLIDQATHVVAECEDQGAKAHLDQAKQAFDLAIDLNGREKTEPALQALRRAREMALKAIRACQGNARLDQRYQQLKGLADRLSEQERNLSGQTVELVSKLVDQAYDQLKMARSQIDSGQTESALASLQAAQLALRQAQSYIGEHQ